MTAAGGSAALRPAIRARSSVVRRSVIAVTVVDFEQRRWIAATGDDRRRAVVVVVDDV
jgi:hypothetical protein